MMSWISSNLPMLLAIWAGLGAVSGIAASKLPAGFWQTFFSVLSHISPANLLAAAKDLGLVNAPAPPLAKPRGFVSMSALFLVTLAAVVTIFVVRSLTGCAAVSPAVAVPVVDVGVCIISTTAQDIAAGMSPIAIVGDDVSKCGADLPTIASLLDAEAKAEIVAADGGNAALAEQYAAVAAAARAADGGAQ